VLDIAYKLLTFAVYIRMIVEAFLFLLLSTILEIKAFNTDSNYSIVSLSIALAIFIILLCFYI